MENRTIPFTAPVRCPAEIQKIEAVLDSGVLNGGGPQTRACQSWLEAHTGCKKALLVPSGTAALEMACLLLDLSPGDEVILPSFTFSSSANAIVLRGAVPVFVDIRPDTLNIDESKIVAAITPRTKAIMPVHYAGVGCQMDEILKIAEKYGVAVIEDAAQGICASYRGRPLGSIGTFGALSFHVSKNIQCGEGGALLINETRYCERAELLWEKGTNRARFLRGEVDKYTWQDIGSSFLLNEVSAALLSEQFERAEWITRERRRIWETYQFGFAPLEAKGLVVRPRIPPECVGNGHIYYLLMPDIEIRTSVIQRLRSEGVSTQFHYTPLHSAPAGRKFARSVGEMSVCEDIAARLLRMPLFPDLPEEDQARVIAALTTAVEEECRRGQGAR